jgi:3-mercaptopyruvate sulfurtransferase SseA
MKALWRLLSLSVLSLALAAPFATPASAGSKSQKSEPFKRLSIKKVGERLGQPNVFIYDGNSAETYAKGHVPGAINLHSSEIKEGVLPAAKDATLIFYCQNTL